MYIIYNISIQQNSAKHVTSFVRLKHVHLKGIESEVPGCPSGGPMAGIPNCGLSKGPGLDLKIVKTCQVSAEIYLSTVHTCHTLIHYV